MPALQQATGWHPSFVVVLMHARSAPALPAVDKHANGCCRNRTTTLALDYINAFVEEKQRLARRGQVLPILCIHMCGLMLTLITGCEGCFSKPSVADVDVADDPSRACP